jgi:hypothetical protein
MIIFKYNSYHLDIIRSMNSLPHNNKLFIQQYDYYTKKLNFGGNNDDIKNILIVTQNDKSYVICNINELEIIKKYMEIETNQISCKYDYISDDRYFITINTSSKTYYNDDDKNHGDKTDKKYNFVYIHVNNMMCWIFDENHYEKLFENILTFRSIYNIKYHVDDVIEKEYNEYDENIKNFDNNMDFVSANLLTHVDNSCTPDDEFVIIDKQSLSNVIDSAF